MQHNISQHTTNDNVPKGKNEKMKQRGRKKMIRPQRPWVRLTDVVQRARALKKHVSKNSTRYTIARLNYT